MKSETPPATLLCNLPAPPLISSKHSSLIPPMAIIDKKDVRVSSINVTSPQAVMNDQSYYEVWFVCPPNQVTEPRGSNCHMRV